MKRLLVLLVLSPQEPDPARAYAERILPVLRKHCLECHSAAKKKGELDLERFATLEDVRRDLRPWPLVAEMLANGEMPPKKSPPLPDDGRRRLFEGVRALLDAEVRARAGDPGRVVVRRLTNAEYDNTVRDLTGVALELTRDFPVDGAAGEGFANTGDALVLSPALVGKYLNAAREIAARAVLLPDGFRFSPSKTARDWTDEAVAAIQKALAPHSKDGRLPLAALEGDGKYARLVREALSAPDPGYPLDRFRGRIDAAEIAAWQKRLWAFHKIGSYIGGKTSRQEPLAPRFVDAQAFRVEHKPAPGEDAVVLTLSAIETPAGGRVVWRRPRLGDALLRDYARCGPRHEVDLKAAFSRTAEYLEAARGEGTPEGLDAEWLARWREVLALRRDTKPGDPATLVPADPLEPLDVPVSGSPKHPAIRGWRSKLGDLPSVLSNASDAELHIPGRASPHRVVVHPLPDRFVAVAWESAAEGTVRVEALVDHAHGGCGNGVAWWTELRRGDRAARIAEGVVNVAAKASIPARELEVLKGDRIVLVVDARDGSHVCDLTEVNLKVGDAELARDVADTILEGNPHGAWSFHHGPSRKASTAFSKIPADSVLGRWRAAPEAGLAKRVQALFTGPRPADPKHPDRLLYDALVAVDGPLFRDLEPRGALRAAGPFGLDPARFEGDDLVATSGQALRIRLPAGLLKERPFQAEAAILDGPERAVQFHASLAGAPAIPDGRAAWTASSEAAKRRLTAGMDAFFRLFPPYVSYPRVIPDDEVVCLKLYHRDDEPLARLFLGEEEARRLDRLWEELRFISRWPVTEHENLPLFIGFVTQDQPKELVTYFEGLREPFRLRAEAFEKDVEAARPAQLASLAPFAEKAWRRPLSDAERASFGTLYGKLREEGLAHDEAFRRVLVRIFVSPHFLFKVEATPSGREAAPVSGPELATRLSYFLWASAPDEELRRAAGRLGDDAVLAAQAERMLSDPKSRGLAVEFGTQWLHVRRFRENREKNEKLFPAFDQPLRDALFEEAALVLHDLFRNGRPLEELLEADFTYLDEALARHYGIPGVNGSAWRRVDGVRRHGRGGVLTLGAVLAQQSGASRTSPVLRGNWVAETLLGDRLPKPPADVPRLPEEEGGQELSVRELTARHTRIPECASCHVRIDPFGFALEAYDAIGRRRERDLAGRPVDATVSLRDGTAFDGLDGLRAHLSGVRKRDVRRTFLRKLLGYALGRSVTLSDQPLLDSMDRDGLTFSEAVRAIVLSPQFRRHRALEATKGE
jgi:hypothetical protein